MEVDKINTCKGKTIQTDCDTQHFYVLPFMGVFVETIQQYKELLMGIKDRQESIIFERVFGILCYQRRITSARNEVIKKPFLPMHPTSYIEGQSILGLPVAGIIIHTVDSNTKVKYIPDHGTVYGSQYKIGAVERLLVEGIQDPLIASGFSQTVAAEYNKVDRILSRTGFDPSNLVRTWHYIHPINEHYVAFNKERKAYFQRSNIGYATQPECVPASTCIEGKCRKTGYSTMNLYYIKKLDNVRIKRVYSSDQKEADSTSYQYGPTFSRALYVAQAGLKELQISGTASIDQDGKTQYIDNPFRQIERTLLLIKGLLMQADMVFNDICYATCIFKNPSDYSTFREVMRKLGLPDFPHIAIKGNICRDDLLFEMDAVAIKHTDKLSHVAQINRGQGERVVDK